MIQVIKIKFKKWRISVFRQFGVSDNVVLNWC